MPRADWCRYAIGSAIGCGLSLQYGENTAFYLVFPLAESMAKAFCRLFLWNFKERLCHKHVVVLSPQHGGNAAFFSKFPLGGIHNRGILLVISLQLQGKKHQPFPMAQPFRTVSKPCPYTMSALGLGIMGHWGISPSVQELLLAEAG